MGIDALDLVFRLEKAFDLKIGREDWAVLFDTAGRLHGYLAARLRCEYREVPQLEPLWKEVSAAVNRIRGPWRLADYRDLNKVFRPENRQASWTALATALALELPPLEQPRDAEHLRIPRECASILALTYWIVEHHPDRVTWRPADNRRYGDLSRHWSDEEIWAVLRKNMSDALGVDENRITADARMIEDLGMD